MYALKALSYVINDPGRKPLSTIAREVAHCTWLEKEIPLYYFTSLLHKRMAPSYRSFIGHRRVRQITKEIFYNPAHGDFSILDDKLKFGNYLTKHGIPHPRILASSSGASIVFPSETVSISSAAELQTLLSKMMLSTKGRSVFVKPLEGIGGKDAFKFSGSATLEDAVRLFELLPNERFIFQETIIQHSAINRIYSGSVNSVRIHSYKDPHSGSTEIISASMRFGAGGSVVDNVSSAGFRVPIDTNTWQLADAGTSSLRNGGRIYTHHPDSHVVLSDVRVPWGDQMASLVRNVASVFDRPFIGWDIAIAEDGLLVIEGNPNPHLIGAQVACGGLRTDPGFAKVFADYL